MRRGKGGKRNDGQGTRERAETFLLTHHACFYSTESVFFVAGLFGI